MKKKVYINPLLKSLTMEQFKKWASKHPHLKGEDHEKLYKDLKGDDEVKKKETNKKK